MSPGELPPIPGAEAAVGAASPAKLTDRFIAYILDAVPFAAGYFGSAVYLITQAQTLPPTWESMHKLAQVWAAAYIAYQAAGNAAGATVGKWLMGLRVRRVGGGPLGLARGLVRAVVIPVSTPLSLGYLWAFVNADSRTWHDLASGAVVVEIEAKGPASALLSALASLLVLASLALGSWWLHVVRPSPEDVERVEKAREGLKILAAVQEEVKARTGSYTAKLGDLALASGDVEEFKSGMKELFDPHQFRLAAGKNRYVISARARDRRRTVVTLAGPTDPRP